MKNRFFPSLVAAAIAFGGPALASASVLATATTAAASGAQLYDVFHDQPSDLVFVKLPQGWAFAGHDAALRSHTVFHDAATGFVFVQLSGGWKFVGRAAA